MEVQTKNRLTRGMEKIVTLFNEMANEEKICLKNLEVWIHERRNTLIELEKFQKELDRIHLCGNTGRVVGNGATVLGGLVTAIGFALSFSKDLKPIGSELMKYGKVVGTVGGATSLSTSLVETGFNAKVLSEVKAALKRDYELTEELLPSFKRAEDLESALNEVFGYGLLSNGMKDILQLIREIYTLKQLSGKSWNKIQQFLLCQTKRNFSTDRLLDMDFQELEKVLCIVSYKMKLLLVELFSSPEMRRATWSIYDCFRKNPASFDYSKLMIRIVRKAATPQTDIIRHSIMSSAGLALQGMFKTVSFALSVIAFVSTVDDIKEERSKYHATIEEVKKCLKKELAILEPHRMNRK